MSMRRTIGGAAFVLPVLLLGCSSDSTVVSGFKYTQRSDGSFPVAAAGVLEVDNFAGNVKVMRGNPGVINLVVTKLAGERSDLDDITVEMVGLTNGARVTTGRSSGITNVSVDIDATVPADVRPDIHTAAGSIDYDGLAQGACSFTTGAGTITLRLPADVNVELDLAVGAGTVQVDFPVVGDVTARAVTGIIGTGAGGKIVARAASGQILVVSQ